MALSKSERDKKYRQTHKEKLSIYFKKRWEEPQRRASNKLYKEKHRFGMDAEEYIKDKYCYFCGIHNSVYKLSTGRRLDINHVDDYGRKALRLGKKPNNEPNNFMVVCRSCHVSWHNRNVRIYGNNNTQSERSSLVRL